MFYQNKLYAGNVRVAYLFYCGWHDCDISIQEDSNWIAI